MLVNLFFYTFLGSGKAITKPKNKNTNPTENNDNTKSKNNTKSSPNNIYQSIMGQIDSTQQDYIKGLIIKNQRQSLKQSQKSAVHHNQIKKSQNNNPPKSKNQQQSLKKISFPTHQRTRSQAQLLKQIVKQNQSLVGSPNPVLKTQITSSQASKTEQRQITEINELIFNQQSKQSRRNINHNLNKTAQQNIKSKDSLLNNENISKNQKNIKKQNYPVNPIIQALNNSSSSFAKKLQVFELQYPQNQQREQRSTHKKVPSKLGSGNYFSCQVSPKNNKSSYTNQVVVTTKPEIDYFFGKKDKNYVPLEGSISPVNSKSNNKNQTQTSGIAKSKKTKQGSFLQCLDEYLQALNVSQNIQDSKKRSMKRTNKNNSKQYIAQPFTLGKQQQEQDTIVLQNNFNSRIYMPYNNMNYSQQKFIKTIQRQNLKINQLLQTVSQYKYELTKQKKKQRKLKQNQYHMIECLKSLNQQLTEQKKQKRKLQEVVKQFQEKIKGISRGKSKQKKQYYHEQRPERKTIYGISSVGNNIHYQHAPLNSMQINMQSNQHHFQNYGDRFYNDKNNSSKLSKHTKKSSKNRFSSMINNFTQQYIPNFMNEDIQYQNHYPSSKQQIIRKQDFNKNRTQKINKIISSFDLDANPLDQQQDEKYNSRNHKNSFKANNRVSNNQQKKSNFMNSSLPAQKSRPMTPKIIQQLFNSSKGRNNQYQNNSQSNDDNSQPEQSYLINEQNKLMMGSKDRMNYIRNNTQSSNQQYQKYENNRFAQYEYDNGDDQINGKMNLYGYNNMNHSQQNQMISRMR